ncbi:hypothetical protein ACTFIW_001507 [Dictyostelium discoideum]
MAGTIYLTLPCGHSFRFKITKHLIYQFFNSRSSFKLLITPCSISSIRNCILSSFNLSNQIKSNQIKSNQIKSNQIKSNQIKSNQIKSNQIKSNQIKSNQIKSNQIKLNLKLARENHQSASSSSLSISSISSSSTTPPPSPSPKLPTLEETNESVVTAKPVVTSSLSSSSCSSSTTTTQTNKVSGGSVKEIWTKIDQNTYFWKMIKNSVLPFDDKFLCFNATKNLIDDDTTIKIFGTNLDSKEKTINIGYLYKHVRADSTIQCPKSIIIGSTFNFGPHTSTTTTTTN